ncbi:MAG: phosphoglycerate mutase [Candidatus Latescibacterota bacterium]|nr:MAG: phosphoglycerate mutase [Candidatus Latescibacterota bacterium]
MVSSEFIPRFGLAREADTKILLLVIDGVGGLPHPDTGLTELEAASIPNLDEIAEEGTCGLIDPIARGIAPGSGVAHLALFGYDPVKHPVGRGAVAALGIGLDPAPEDLTVRMNFATERDGVIVDRRAGRLPDELNDKLCDFLRENVRLEGVSFTLKRVKDYRAVVVFKGEGLSDQLTDADPGRTGFPPPFVEAKSPEAERSASIANEFLRQVRELLKTPEARKIVGDPERANTVLMRGFAHPSYLPPFREVYKLRAGAIATYPDYLGVARMVGMDILDTGDTVADEVATLKRFWDQYDFFFLHIKKTDSAGEDGDFLKKVHLIEEVDSFIPQLLSLNPDVFVVTGDHSTPALFKAHSWHPVPVAFRSRWCRRDAVSAFSERECVKGYLGRFTATELMALILAYSERSARSGA